VYNENIINNEDEDWVGDEELSKKSININSIILKQGHANLYMDTSDSHEYRRNFGINMIDQKLVDKFLIEQVYPELKLHLINYLKNEKEILEKYELFLEDIKTKFGKQLIANTL
jgi:hypothetical protein